MERLTRKTIGRATTLEGVGLHSGARVRLRMAPSAAGTGISFMREDLPGSPRLSLPDLFEDGPPFRTALKRGDAEVHTVEHLLSALAGLGVTDVLLALNGLEVPGLDGSAEPFVVALQRAGIEPCAGPALRPVTVDRALSVAEGSARIDVLPYAGACKISYTLDYPGEPLAQGSLTLVLDEETYAREIAPARTFCLRKEAEALRAAGFGLGAGTHNTLVLDGPTVLDASLRFPDEPVRHKMLDLIGDLYLLGRPVWGHIVASRSGHRQNRALAKLLGSCGGAA